MNNYPFLSKDQSIINYMEKMEEWFYQNRSDSYNEIKDVTYENQGQNVTID